MIQVVKQPFYFQDDDHYLIPDPGITGVYESEGHVLAVLWNGGFSFSFAKQQLLNYSSPTELAFSLLKFSDLQNSTVN